jgi:hypothetical protein
MQRRADGTLPKQGEVIGSAVLDRAARLRCPSLRLHVRDDLGALPPSSSSNSLDGRSLAGGANHSRREIAALGWGDPDGETLSGWSDGFRGLVGSLAVIAPDRPAQTIRRRL